MAVLKRDPILLIFGSGKSYKTIVYVLKTIFSLKKDVSYRSAVSGAIEQMAGLLLNSTTGGFAVWCCLQSVSDLWASPGFPDALLSP